MTTLPQYSTATGAGRFYVMMAAACAFIAFAGFAPTYWLQLPAGTFLGTPLLHLHGLLFSAWPLLLLSQAVLASGGRLETHRAWGVAGVALASAMVVTGVATAIVSLNSGLAAGYGDRARGFFIVPLSVLGLFAGFVVAALLNTRRPEAHKRLMMLATISLLQASVARVFFVLSTGGGPGMRPGLSPPVSLGMAVVPGLLLDGLILAGVVHDWRTRGKPHPAWLIGLAAITAVLLVRIPIATTAAWQDFAQQMTRFAG